MKNTPFDSLFLVNFVFFLRIFSVLEIYQKIGGSERLLDDVRFIPNLSFNVENFLLVAF